MSEDETLTTINCHLIGISAVVSRIGLPISNLQRIAFGESMMAG